MSQYPSNREYNTKHITNSQMSLSYLKEKKIQFDHDKLDVYHIALEFVLFADKVIQTMPKGKAYLNDQLQRAALSIPLNIAEGAGEFSMDEKARFYRIAKRSATECSAILHVCQKLQLIEDAEYEHGRDLLIRIVSMLIKMAQKTY